jgi:hypothetical protein
MQKGRRNGTPEAEPAKSSLDISEPKTTPDALKDARRSNDLKTKGCQRK